MNLLRSMLIGLALSACCIPGLSYQDQYTQGVPNLHAFAPHMWRTGVPPDIAAWSALRDIVTVPGRSVTRISLHDAAEASEAQAYAFGWRVIEIPLYPEDDKPWTVLLRPNRADVQRAVNEVISARDRGDVVVWGCVHDRERGGLVSALVGMKLYGWSEEYAFSYMLATGSRIEVTPGLLTYWLEEER